MIKKIVIPALIWFACFSGAWAATLKKETARFSFSYSDEFLVGKYAPWGSNAVEEIALVEKKLYALFKQGRGKDWTLETLPVGEIPTITIQHLKGSNAKVGFGSTERLIKDKTIVVLKIGGRDVQKWPAYPGMFGEAVFYYVVPIGKEEVITFMALTKVPTVDPISKSEKMVPSGYDKVIESILSSLTLK